MPKKAMNHLMGYVTSTQYPHGHPDRRPPQPFVTLSRQTGAGGISISQALCDRLNEIDTAALTPWTLLDRNLLQTVIDEHDLPSQIASRMDQTQYNSILKWCDDMFGNYYPSWTAVIKKTGETILHFARMGNVILVGRGAHIITRSIHGGLHARLIGSIDKRMAHLEEYYELSEDKAAAMLKRNDRGRTEYLRDVFHTDINDTTQFDLCINTDHLAYEDATEMLAQQVLRNREAISQLAQSDTP